MKPINRIGIVAGGGDCAGLNAVIGAAARATAMRGCEPIGILDGYEGLLGPQQTVALHYHGLSGLLVRASAIQNAGERRGS